VPVFLSHIHFYALFYNKPKKTKDYKEEHRRLTKEKLLIFFLNLSSKTQDKKIVRVFFLELTKIIDIIFLFHD
jgi:hypothetical protein